MREKLFGGVLHGVDVVGGVSDAVSTGCGPLDTLLGGGLERGAVTQVYGPPASGKTNVALSAAVTAAKAGETVVYIDTEGLSSERFRQVLGEGDPAVRDRIIFRAVHSFEEQREAVRGVSEFAEQAALIVVDSATGYYRLERTNEGDGETLRGVARQVTSLLGLARKHELAVLVTNQVYTDPESDRTKPLGGHTLAHWTGVVVRLDRFRGGKRRATLEKHRSRPAGESMQFQITETGLEGVDEDSY